MHAYGAVAKSVLPSANPCALESTEGKRAPRVLHANVTAINSNPLESLHSENGHTGRRVRVQAPECRRVDSGYYSGVPSSAERATPPPRSSSLGLSLDEDAPLPAPGTVTRTSIPMPKSYQVTEVSTPRSFSVYGRSAPDPISTASPQTMSEREFANNPPHPRFLAKYTIQGELGFGATGFVVAARRLEDGQAVAVKFMFKDRIPVENWLRDRQLGTVPLEIFILKRLDHENIVRYLDFYEDKKFFYLVMETHGIPWVSFKDENTVPSPTTTAAALKTRRPSRRASQDLFECIEQNPFMEERDVRHIFSQIATAVAYLHQNNIVHRDIKDENIVIDLYKNVKLIDFGNAAFIPRSERDYFDRFYGTMHCAAPEILRGEKYRGPEQDVWALGVLLYTLSFSQTPFKDAAGIMAGRYTSPRFSRSSPLLGLLSCLLEPNVAKRATMDDVLRHEWISGQGTVVSVD
ncbi:hypothetical protein SpCBS45565_g04816 [Spizellomyces sp. 'palustris']|nr:hypothetical protein SpCBS45565_g04816 [Spizellomyces sp. 'palustris']